MLRRIKTSGVVISSTTTIQHHLRFISSSSSKPQPQQDQGHIEDYQATKQSLITKCIHDATDVIPHQGVLKVFVHHNPLSSFEKYDFIEAQERYTRFQSYNNMNDRALHLFGVDPRKRCNEALSELSSAFLDCGAAKLEAPDRDEGFLHFFASLEHLGFAPWRRHARHQANRILKQDPHLVVSNSTSSHHHDGEKADLSKIILEENLRYFGIPEEEWEFAIRAALRDLRGWAGMFSRMESHPEEAPRNAFVRLVDFAAVQSILTRSSIEGMIHDVLPGSEMDRDVAKWLSIAPKWAEDHSVNANNNANCENRGIFNSSSKKHLGLLEALHLKNRLAAASSVSPLPKTLKHVVEEKQKERLRPHTIVDGVDVDAEAEKETHESAIAFIDQTIARRDFLEKEYKHTFLYSIGTSPVQKSIPEGTRPSFQFWTCMDDREGSFRRHIEEQAPHKIETFGVPGFFALPIYYRPLDGREETRLAPVGNIPKYTLIEREKQGDERNFFLNSDRRRMLAKLQVLYEKATFFAPTAILLSAVAWPFTALRLFSLGLAPIKTREIVDSIQKKFIPPVKTDFDIPFPLDEAGDKVGSLLNDIGLTKNVARVVVIIGHGASSVNNPFLNCYQCGACSGQSGDANARLFARVANHPEVRTWMKKNKNVIIPDDTHFIGAVHNTTADTIEYFDLDLVPVTHQEDFAEAAKLVQTALERNALERCDKFLLASNVKTPKEAVEHVRRRSIDPAEVRPELNHATNAAVVIGRRDLTKNRFLDRRAFLPSYDPFNDDDRGTNLEHVIAPALVVCSGINLEYLFSTVKDDFGAGTKAPLNVVGQIAVIQGVNGDLRTGLPTQMTEMHTPIREIFIVDAPIARIEAVFKRRPDLARLVRNHWIRFVARDPTTNKFFMHRQNGEYEEIEPVSTRGQAFKLFQVQKQHGAWLTELEDFGYKAALAGLFAAWFVPSFILHCSSASSLAVVHPTGIIIAAAGSSLAVPVITFGRKYLHGERMFLRFAFLSVALVLGFNLVATAPTLHAAIGGWSLFGFASTGLISIYNNRATVKTNATFAFAAYRVGDTALIAATAMAAMSNTSSASSVAAATWWSPHAAALCLIIASFWKMSQWPMTSIFARSMEGPTPSSALGYGGLSAHFGVVLLANFSEIWSPFPWAHLLLTAGGLVTAVCSSLISWTRSDRKGSIAYANSATVGLILVVLAQGYTNTALIMCLGNATIRIAQILRAPSAILDTQNLQAALRAQPWHYPGSKKLYRAAWALRRFDTDFHLVHPLQVLTRRWQHSSWSADKLTRNQQYFITALVVILAGFPFTPLSDFWEHQLIELFQTHPTSALLLSLIHFVFAVIAMRILLWKVLNVNRFKH